MSSLASDTNLTQRGRPAEMDPVILKINEHYQQLGKQNMKISELLSEKAQYDTKMAYMQKDKQVSYKMTMLKEVRQQKYIVTNRKTQFRIQQTQVKKLEIAQDKKDNVMKEYERKISKGLAEGEEIYTLIVEVWTWQMRWIVSLQVLNTLEKIQHIGRYRML